MDDFPPHIFTAAIDLHGLSEEEAEALESRLKFAIYDVLDDGEVTYRAVSLAVTDTNKAFEELETERPDKDDIGGFRSGDPDTSRKGAIDVYPRTGHHRHKALMAIARSGDHGMTYAEVEAKTGVNGIWKRISELKEGGWVQVAGERLIRDTRSMGDIYILTERAERHIEQKEKAGVIG